MAEALVIVESPAKAKTIGKYLGKKFIVKASMGHVRDLPKSQMGVNVEHNFDPRYITIRGKGEVLKELRDAGKKVKRIYLAADPDREGEAIAWHLAQSLNITEGEACRVVFHEITKDAVKDAFQQPRRIDMNLVNAQQARRILDRLVGYNISPLLWKKVKKGLSAGRVQSVAVKMIIDREREIEAFLPQEYWSITAQLAQKGIPFEAKYYGRDGQQRDLPNESLVQQVLREIEGQDFVVREVRESQRRRNPAPTFTTSTLQQEAARKLNFRAARTMSVAQQLYEGVELGREGSVGLITYMRTDSTRVSPVAQAEVRQFILQQFGEPYIPAQVRVQELAQGAQDAHEGVRPTSVMHTPEQIKGYLSRDQYRLYKLIWERFVASQMAPAVLDTVSADIFAGDHMFRASGSKLRFPGFMKVYIEGNDDNSGPVESYLPELTAGDGLELRQILPEQHFTQPPPRYTEARLVRTMEEKGIGRPSTYAPTLDTIQKRGYVTLQDKRFLPTELGQVVIELLEDFFTEILDVEFTAHLESSLDQVEEGDVDWVSLLHSFYEEFEEKLKRAQAEMKDVEIKDEVSDEVCEKCGRHMVYKMGRYGKFLACSGFPDCRNAKPIVKEVGVACPKCTDGQIVERKSKKRRTFYGCSNYPECDFVSWDRPASRACPRCGGFAVQKVNKKKEVSIECSSCKYREVEAVAKEG